MWQLLLTMIPHCGIINGIHEQVGHREDRAYSNPAPGMIQEHNDKGVAQHEWEGEQ
jgi:hypothetical protein